MFIEILTNLIYFKINYIKGAELLNLDDLERLIYGYTAKDPTTKGKKE